MIAGREMPRADARDAGFTMVELLVTMLVTGIVLALLGTFFANISRLTSWSGSDRDATGQAALALDAVRAVVRVATDNPTSSTAISPAIVAGSGTTLVINAYSNTAVTGSAPVQVTFAVDAATGIMTEKRQQSTMSAGYYVFNGPVTSRTVARGFQVTGAATPFFTYVDAGGNVLSASPGLGDPSKVTFIRVTTTLVPASARPGDPIIVTTSIGMPNLSRNVSANVSVPNLPTPTATPTTTPPVPTSSAPTTTTPTTTTPTTTTPTTTTPTTTTPTTTTPTTTTPTTTTPTTTTPTTTTPTTTTPPSPKPSPSTTRIDL